MPRITKLIESKPQVESITSQLGRPEDGTDAKLSNNLEFFVRLKAPHEWPKSTPELSDVIADLQRPIEEIPGLEVNFSQPIRDNVNESISGQQGQIAVKLYGDDLTVLQQQAEKVKNEIAKVAGVADLGIVKSGEVPQVQVTPDRVALRFDDRAWTYAELNTWANRLAHLWASRGIGSLHGARIGERNVDVDAHGHVAVALIASVTP